MCVCVLVLVFKCWHSWRAVPIPTERKEKDQGGGYEASVRLSRLGGLKKIRLHVARSLSGQGC